MEPITEATAPLSCLESTSSALLAETIVTEYSKAFLALASVDFGAAEPELFSVIKRFVDSGGGWTPQFGAFESAVRSGSTEVILARAVQLALLAHDRGIDGRWQVALDQETCLRLGQQAVVQLTGVSIDATSTGYEVQGHAATGERFALAVGRNAATEPDPLLTQLEFDDVPVRLTTTLDLDAVEGMNFLSRDQWRVSADLVRIRKEFSEVESWLRHYSPRSVLWIRTVLRHLVITNPGTGLMESGSSRAIPGFVHMSHGHTLALAEMLVHELTHQYYYIATRLGPVDDGTDDKLYWSPVKRTGRPVANILLAYHAFGNVVLLMRDALNSAAEPADQICENMTRVISDLKQLQEGLESTHSLTEVGVGLYRPLREALRLDSLT